MTIEERLREAFAAQADRAKGADDPAGRAIRRARTIRRRRALGSGLAAAVLAVTGLGAAAWTQRQLPSDGVAGPVVLPTGAVAPPADPPVGRPTDPPAAPRSADPTPSPRVSTRAGTVAALSAEDMRRLGLDLRVGRQLWSTAGRRYALTGAGEVTRVYRVPAGWVYGGVNGVRLLRPDGASTPLPSLGTRWLISPDGTRLADVRDGRLTVYRIGAGGLTRVVGAAVPASARPVAFAGERVVVSSGGGRAADGVTDGVFGSLSAREPYRPIPVRGLVDVYGGAGDAMAGLVWEPERREVCLAALAPGDDGLEVSRSGSCRTDPEEPSGALLAPGGGWLARPGANGMIMVEVDEAVRDARWAVSCPMISAVPPAWADARTLVVAGRGLAMRCGTDGTRTTLALPDGLADWSFVPRLMSPAPR